MSMIVRLNTPHTETKKRLLGCTSTSFPKRLRDENWTRQTSTRLSETLQDDNCMWWTCAPLHHAPKQRRDCCAPPHQQWHDQYMNVQHQCGGSDYGLFTLAFATTLCAGIDPTTCSSKQELMRNHFLSCIIKEQIEQFPIKQWRRAITLENFHDRMILCNGSCKQWDHNTYEHIEDHIWNSKLQWYHNTCEHIEDHNVTWNSKLQ